METPNVIKGADWNQYLKDNDFESRKQMELYNCTHRYTPLYKIGEYYFSFRIMRGYKNLTSLKRLI